MSTSEYPTLRPLDFFHVQLDGKSGVGIRDPLGLSENQMILTGLGPFLVGLMDGQHTVLDIQAEVMRNFGHLLQREEIHRFIDDLDSAYLLDNDRFQRLREEVEAEFLRSPVRPAHFAGKAYQDEPTLLRGQLDAFFSDPEGPGAPGVVREGYVVKGAIVPHIDFQRGGPVFAWAYRELMESEIPELFVVMGTGHAPAKNPFIATRKDFDTPLGALTTDQDFLDELQRRASHDLFSDEPAHRAEHSLEFQMVFLRYLLGGEHSFAVVPILCGSFHDMVTNGMRPVDDPLVGSFIKALKETVAGCGKRVCFISSVDLAHVGPKFGDSRPLSPGDLRVLQEEDHALLRTMERCDPEGFFRLIQDEGDRRRICGCSSIYTMLHAMSANEGKLLRYAQWPDPTAVVSFASMVFT